MRRNGLWAALDSGLFRNPKFLRCTPPAKLLYIHSILYSADILADGIIVKEYLPTLFATTHAKKRHVQELVDNGLWDVENPVDKANGPWQIHDYLDWNPERKWHQDRRERDRAKKAKARANKRKTTIPAHPMSPGDRPGEPPFSYVRQELNPNSALRDVTVENLQRPNSQAGSNPDLTNHDGLRHSGFGMANPDTVERQPETVGGELEALMQRLSAPGGEIPK